jgi:hypothetical protein
MYLVVVLPRGRGGAAGGGNTCVCWLGSRGGLVEVSACSWNGLPRDLITRNMLRRCEGTHFLTPGWIHEITLLLCVVSSGRCGVVVGPYIPTASRPSQGLISVAQCPAYVNFIYGPISRSGSMPINAAHCSCI